MNSIQIIERGCANPLPEEHNYCTEHGERRSSNVYCVPPDSPMTAAFSQHACAALADRNLLLLPESMDSKRISCTGSRRAVRAKIQDILPQTLSSRLLELDAA
eukprot:IDg23630t1